MRNHAASGPRKSGIDVLGNIPWGSHFCVFYETKQDLIETLAPYIKAGLENNEFNLLIISNPYFTTVEDATATLERTIPDVRTFLKNGNLEILVESIGHQDKGLTAEQLFQKLKEKALTALARGFDGIRAFGDVFWIEPLFSKSIYFLEKQLHNLVTDLPAIILCAYPLEKFGGGQVFDMLQAHQFAVSRTQGRWELIEIPTLVQDGAEMKKITGLLEEDRTPPRMPEAMSYLVAVLSVAVALLLAYYVVDAPVALFLCANLVSARYGGTRPGLLSFALSLLAFGYFFLDPLHHWAITPAGASRGILLTVLSLFVVLLAAAQTSSARFLRRAHDALALVVRQVRETNGSLRMEIGERTRAEDELRLAYQRLTYHVENTPLAVIELDRSLNITRWSGRAEEIFGWKASEALGENVYDPKFPIIYGDDKTAVDRINNELTQGAVNRNVSHNRNHTKSGEVIYSEWYNSVLRDDQGKVITILSLVQDVTERKKAEETLNRSYEEIRQLTNHLQNIREEERSNIARDIHDELGQQLTVLKMDIFGIGKKFCTADLAFQEKIHDIIHLIDQTVRSVRRISSELRPSLLYDLGLVAAIDWQLREFEKRSGIRTTFIEPAEELTIPDPIKNCLFRIFQESLTNAGRHAHATKIIVSLELNSKKLTLTLEDNGQGFDTRGIGAKRTLGILGMRERCQMMEGDFEIRSNTGEGTTVVATVPYDEKI